MKNSLANYLVNTGLLDADIADQYVQLSQHKKISLISFLVTQQILSAKSIAHCCAKHFGLDYFELDQYNFQWLDQSFLTDEFILFHRVIPMGFENNMLTIGISDPTNKEAVNATLFATGLPINPVIVAEDQLTVFLKQHYDSKRHSLLFPEELLSEIDQIPASNSQISPDEPLIQFVDKIISNAILQSVSDIHIEPFEKICKIRYRKDGILYLATQIPTQISSRIVTRLKVIAKLDMTERRLPQDGRLQYNSIDIRISTCPTQHGEKIVLRLLDTDKASLNIEDLGFTKTQLTTFLAKISQPQGLILVTGPTGSGKTITLYSAINQLNTNEKNILTIEDPVEIQLTGINQMSTHAKVGLDFSNALRSFLRQDPDVMMIGEIRDLETANIAIQASQTGHLVFSTLHTNSAIETLTRLQNLGIPAYNVVSSISVIIAQRLIRKLCIHCKILDPNTAVLAYRAMGCDACLKGYHGRTAIYEVLPMTNSLAELILSGAHPLTLAKHAVNDGLKTLYEIGLEKVTQGITSFAELHRVTQNEFK